MGKAAARLYLLPPTPDRYGTLGRRSGELGESQPYCLGANRGRYQCLPFGFGSGELRAYGKAKGDSW
jgi:hypothetical protein